MNLNDPIKSCQPNKLFLLTLGKERVRSRISDQLEGVLPLAGEFLVEENVIYVEHFFFL
jgi:hypothetical protein